MKHYKGAPDSIILPDTSTVWFLSFGDLLTLLLCFFLVLTQQHALPRNNVAILQGVAQTETVESGAGTQIASHSSEGVRGLTNGVPIAVSLEEQHDSGAVQAEFLAGWSVFREHLGPEPRDVTVRLCSGRFVEELMESVYRERLALYSRIRSFKVEVAAMCELGSISLSPQRELVALLEFSRV